jgi:tRNA (adenine22-N1)-methyltransferase
LLSKRLTAIADFIPDSSGCADIGTDHAYLLVALADRNPKRVLIGVELNSKPLETAKDNLKKAGLDDRIQLRLGDGLTKVLPGEVETVVIAGMGSKTMLDILESSPQVVKRLDRLIVQPMVGVEQVRRWLTQNGFYIEDEELIFEDGQYYQIILALPGSNQELSATLLTLGPKLVEKKHPLLLNYIEQLIMKYEEIVKQMIYYKTDLEEKDQRFAEIKTKISELKAVKNIVSKG